jgi:hypothetical protein
MAILRCALTAVLFMLVAGCSAMFVPRSNNPEQKLAQAYELFDNERRPIPAEKLIREAMDIYKMQNNMAGLAEVYRAYGFFYRSAAVEEWQKYYESTGFLDRTVTYNTRFRKSVEAFEYSAQLFAKQREYDSVANVYLNMAFTYEFARDLNGACASYKKSLDAFRNFQKLHPGASVSLPDGFTGTYEEFVARYLRKNQCL